MPQPEKNRNSLTKQMKLRKIFAQKIIMNSVIGQMKKFIGQEMFFRVIKLSLSIFGQ